MIRLTEVIHSLEEALQQPTFILVQDSMKIHMDILQIISRALSVQPAVSVSVTVCLLQSQPLTADQELKIPGLRFARIIKTSAQKANSTWIIKMQVQATSFLCPPPSRAKCLITDTTLAGFYTHLHSQRSSFSQMQLLEAFSSSQTNPWHG